MTGASPVTPIHDVAWLCHAMVVSIGVTGLAPVMPHASNIIFLFNLIGVVGRGLGGVQ